MLTGCGATAVTWESLTVPDGYSVESQTHQSGQLFPVGVTDVTYEVVELSTGVTASCTFTVDVFEGRYDDPIPILYSL